MPKLILSLLLSISLSTATIIHVPDSVLIIQGAIDIAQTSDTILVHPGQYFESIDLSGKSITIGSLYLIYSNSNLIDQTVLDGDNAGSVVSFQNGEDSTTILCGFTITHGNGNYADPDGDGNYYNYGGGIYCLNSSPNLRNLIISGNTGDYGGGGGIFCYSASPLLQDVDITGNSTNDVGGGIYCRNSSTPLFNSVSISNNLATFGGGIYCRDNSIIEMENVSIRNNTAGSVGGGLVCKSGSDIVMNQVAIQNNSAGDLSGGLYCNAADPVLDHVIITGNQAVNGGGIYCREASSLTLTNVTLSNNIATGDGDGVYLRNGSSLTILNSIFWYNNSTGIYYRSNETACSVTVSFSNIEGDSAGIITNDNGTISWLTGNIHQDPFFCDLDEGDFTVAENSVCLGSGQDGADMGALGIGCEPVYRGPVWYVATDGSNSNDGSHQAPYGSIQYCIDNINPGDTVLVLPGHYYGSIIFNGKNIVVLSSCFWDSTGVNISETILDGEQNGRVIIFNNNEDSSAVLSGFTIINGAFSHGGGIYINGASPRLFNLVLENNTANYGGGVYLKNSRTHISQTIFWNNTADYGGAIYADTADFYLGGTTLQNNSAFYGAGIYCNRSSPDLEQVVLIENDSYLNGGGMYYTGDSQPQLDRITLAANTAFINGAGIYCDNAFPNVSNSIIWGNQPDEIYLATGTVTISFSDIAGGWSGSTNLDTLPYFCNPDSGDYSLAENSPCLSAGENGVNMGALEIGCTEVLVDVLEEGDFLLNFCLHQGYPNPFNSALRITYDVPRQVSVKLRVFDLTGRLVNPLFSGLIEPGRYSILWNGTGTDGRRVASGIYLIVLEADQFRLKHKCLLLK